MPSTSRFFPTSPFCSSDNHTKSAAFLISVMGTACSTIREAVFTIAKICYDICKACVSYVFKPVVDAVMTWLPPYFKQVETLFGPCFKPFWRLCHWSEHAVLITEDGNFNFEIEQHLKLADEKDLIGTISVIGRQNTGKSTLLNRCFSTDFQEMDISRGIQSARGVWIAKRRLPGCKQKLLVIDTEGTGGFHLAEEGYASFEKKVSCFALAMSNVLIFKMNSVDTGNNLSSGLQLFEMLFPELIRRKFTGGSKLHLVIVLRDTNKTLCSEDTLKKQLIPRLHEMWNNMSAPEDKQKPALEDYLKIEVVAMSHFVYQREQYNEEVEDLKNLISSLVQKSSPETASSFIERAEENWRGINGNKLS